MPRVPTLHDAEIARAEAQADMWEAALAGDTAAYNAAAIRIAWANIAIQALAELEAPHV